MKPTRTNITRAFVIAYLLIFIFIGLYDPPLEADVAEFLKLPTDNVAEADNGFYAMFGFGAPADQKMHSYGLTRYKATIQASQNGQLEQYNPKDKLVFKGKDLPKENLYRFASESRSPLDQLTTENSVLLARYRELRNFSHISEPVTVESLQALQIPSFMPIRSAQTLHLLLILRNAHEGQTDQALADLESDLAFWRSTLKEARSLIAKLLAAASIQKDYQIASELIRHATLSQHQMQRLALMLPTWTPEAIRMDQAFRFEAQFLSESLNRTPGKVKWLERLFFKKNATRNKMTRTFMEISKVSLLPPDKLYSLRKQNSAPLTDQVRIGIDFLYNPVGAILNSIAVPNFNGYLYRASTLEVKRRMLLIQLKAKQSKATYTYTGMTSFINQLGPEYANPYTNQPMLWDARKNAIYMESPESSQKDAPRIELPI